VRRCPLLRLGDEEEDCTRSLRGSEGEEEEEGIGSASDSRAQGEGTEPQWRTSGAL